MERVFGFHHLAALGSLQPGDGAKLYDAARIAAEAGCQLFELACNPVTTMPFTEVVEALRAAGIGNMSYCRFFPNGENGDAPPFGDPTADGVLFKKAVETIRKDLEYMDDMRNAGINVEYMTGPSCFVLGKELAFHPDEAMARMVRFLLTVKQMFMKADFTMCLEYLRPGEDNGYIAGIDRMVQLLKKVDSHYIKWHGDIYHMLEQEEDPAISLRKGGKWLQYLHAHGTDRSAPGSQHDRVDWTRVADALNEIRYTGPVVPEPFGATIRKQVPVLGEGLPAAVPADMYYKLAHEKLSTVGILPNS